MTPRSTSGRTASAGGPSLVAPLDGGAATPLTSFADEQIFNFAWSRDGRQLAVSQGEVTSDVVMVTTEEKK